MRAISPVKPSSESDAHASADTETADQIRDSRFVISQILAVSGYPNEARAELEAVRPLLTNAIGADSTQVRNLDKQSARLRSAR